MSTFYLRFENLTGNLSSYKRHHPIAYTLIFNVVLAYHGDDLSEGPFCGLSAGRGKCCDGRQDDCSYNITSKFGGREYLTKCYCDNFCKHDPTHDDCCPDYEVVCLGDSEYYISHTCEVNATKIEGCNLCTCKLDASGNADWDCASEPCLMNEDVARGINLGGSWKARANYSQFAGKTLDDGLKYKLGTLEVGKKTRGLGSVTNNIIESTDQDFDARKMWGPFISPIVDQGWCGSDWAVSTASIITDRCAIATGQTRMLSPQSLLCDQNQKGCNGGYTDRAWIYAFKTGVVEESCLPYTTTVATCPRNQRACTNRLTRKRYLVSRSYKIDGEEEIKKDIIQNGPVQATMTVYQDFFHYGSGIYNHTIYGDVIKKGLHAVKIIGWGEENGTRYWLVANSWGREWGEEGYFRIVRGENVCDIESFVVASFCDEPGQKK